MNKILLIFPPICNFTGYSIGHTPPLGLLYLAAVLEKEGYKVKVLDAEALCLSWDALAEKIKSESPDVVGIGSTSISLPALLKTAEICGQVAPEAKIIVGGPGPTFEPEKVLRANSSIEAVVLREGEKTIVELMKWLEGRRQLNEIKGIAYRQGEEIIKTPAQELVMDLDSIPLPAYHLLEPNFLQYSGLHGDYPELQMPNAVIMGSRGCPHRCVFCSNNKTQNRLRDPQKVVDEIEYCYKVVGAKSIQLYDDEFVGMSPHQNKWVREICDEIIKRNLNHLGYLVQGRCSPYVELETLEKMKQAGVKWVWWGVESGSQRVLDAVKKDIQVVDIKRSFYLAKQAGLKSLMFVMVGLPSETEEDAMMSGQLIEEVNPDRVRIHITTPLPGSEMWQSMHEKNQIEDYDILNYNNRIKAVHHTDTLSKKKIEQIYQMLLFRYESNKRNFIKLFLMSFISLNELKKLPQRIKKVFLYVPKWIQIRFH